MRGEGGKGKGNGESGSGAFDLERELGRLRPAAVPPGLRDRILETAAAARRGVALPPWMRVAAAAAAALVAVLLALDPLLSRQDAAHLAAVLDGRPAAPPAGEDSMALAEAVGAGTGAKEAARLARLETLASAARRQEQGRQAIEAREWLKGWLENETFEDLE